MKKGILFHFASRLAILAVLVAATSGTARADGVSPIGSPQGLVVFITVSGILPLTAPAGFFGQQGGNPSQPLSQSPIDVVGVPSGLENVLISSLQLSGSGSQSIPTESVGLNFGKIELKYSPSSKQSDTQFKVQSFQLNTVGSTTTIPVEIVSMSLVSTQPIQVSYGSGGNSFFDVVVTLNPMVSQQPGSLTLNRTSKHGGTFNVVFPVNVMFTFTNTNSGGPAASGPIFFQDTYSATGNFTVVPEPATLLLVGSGAAAAYWHRRKRIRGSS
jgi:hypothetical protein